FYLESGATGLFANCLSSEMFHLTPEERLAVTETVVRAVNDRVPVIATGTFSADQQVNADFMNRLYDLGVEGVVINSSQLCPETDGEAVFRSRLEDLVGASAGIPLGIYECPVPYKRLLSTEIIKWMARSERFFYMKDTSCDNVVIRDRLAVIGNSRLALFNANTPTAVQSLRDGAAGLSPIGANFYPELYQFLFDHARGEETHLFSKVKSFLTVGDLVVHALYPFSAKWFLQQRGLHISTVVRERVPEVVPEEMIRLQELMAMMRELFESIGFRPSNLPS
ncbi:MAG: dihydrodipicolinate synthase family protein, partial [Bacteroidales bacterium]